MATIQKFEDLQVWKKARCLAQKIYPLTFIDPISSGFRFKIQIRGSAGSIMDNISEGFERGSKLEFINALMIAKGEVGELKSQLYRGFDNHYFTQQVFDELYNLANEVKKMLTSLISYLNTSKTKGQKFKDWI